MCRVSFTRGSNRPHGKRHLVYLVLPFQVLSRYVIGSEELSTFCIHIQDFRKIYNFCVHKVRKFVKNSGIYRVVCVLIIS